jgi:hypothetical protein
MELIKNENGDLQCVNFGEVFVDSDILSATPKRFIKGVMGAMEEQITDPKSHILFSLATYVAIQMKLAFSDNIQIEYQRVSNDKHKVVITKDGNRKYCYYRKSPIAKSLKEVQREMVQAINDGYLSIEVIQQILD